MSYELRQVRTPEERAAMHEIRRATLFTPERGVVYDEDFGLSSQAPCP